MESKSQGKLPTYGLPQLWHVIAENQSKGIVPIEVLTPSPVLAFFCTSRDKKGVQSFHREDQVSKEWRDVDNIVAHGEEIWVKAKLQKGAFFLIPISGGP